MDDAILKGRAAAVAARTIERDIGIAIHDDRTGASNDAARLDRSPSRTGHDASKRELVGTNVDRTRQRQLVSKDAGATPGADERVTRQRHTPRNNCGLIRPAKGSSQRTCRPRTAGAADRQIVCNSGAIPDGKRAAAAHYNAPCAQGVVVGIRTRSARTRPDVAARDVRRARLAIAAGQVERARASLEEARGYAADIARNRQAVPRRCRCRIRTREQQPIVNDIATGRQSTGARCRDQTIRKRQVGTIQRENGRLTGRTVICERQGADVDRAEVVGVRRSRSPAKQQAVVTNRSNLQPATPVKPVRPQAVATTRPRPVSLRLSLVHPRAKHDNSGKHRDHNCGTRALRSCEIHF